jgi:hypothetical protein
MVGGIAVLWAAWSLVAARWPTAPRVLVPGAIVATAALAVASSVGLAGAGVPEEQLSGQVGAVAPEVRAALPTGDGPVVVDGQTSWGGLVQGAGLVLALERAGVDARFPTVTGAGSARTDDGGVARARLVVVTGDDVPAALEQPDLELVAFDGVMDLATLRSRVARGDVVPDDDALAVFRRSTG